MKILLFIIAFLSSTVSHGQKPKNYVVVRHDTTGKEKFAYVFTNQRGDTVTRLDRSKYYVCFSDTIQYFAIVGIKNKKGWWAIDRNERPLFEVYNTSSDEPSPDELREGLIRIVNNSGQIEFAKYNGKIVIKPQFEAASSFYREKQLTEKNVSRFFGVVKEKTKTSIISQAVNKQDTSIYKDKLKRQAMIVCVDAIRNRVEIRH
jgi:hypothetical protein